jgi:hypothetical protein
VVAGGNVEEFHSDHIVRSDLEYVHDPGQAWNALTVGAYTDLAVIDHGDYDDWRPVALPGDLSPYSTTSVSFSRTWPVKPDIVMEGGNVAHDGGSLFQAGLPSMSLVSTYHDFARGLLVPTWATSAAAAQVARLAARLQRGHPEFWPETIRGLIVSSARWTPRMKTHLPKDPRQSARENLVRRFGLGVPDEVRATMSAKDALTLVGQYTIHPFDDGRLREIHLHELPWPRDALASLGESPVTLRVTLSYFVEPNPGRRGWKLRHSYASHGLRFDVKGPLEPVEDFHARLNQMAYDESMGERPKAQGAGANWFLGSQVRHRGSLHTDIWSGTAIELAERGVLAVYPVSGWWKERKARDRSEVGSRYALIVSIEAPEAEVDIWTPVAQMVGVPIEV